MRLRCADPVAKLTEALDAYAMDPGISIPDHMGTCPHCPFLHMDERFPTRRHIADCPLLQSFDIIVLAI